ncbi:MAG: hypothetical protein ACFFFH_00600 [Candidatus Thorarchaeota archaeon]
MSPVCKKCRNYVMGFPCPHCGGDQALTDREADEIRPIIPLDLQESFKEPPPPKDTSDHSYDPPYQTFESQPISPPTPTQNIHVSAPSATAPPAPPPPAPTPAATPPPAAPSRTRPSYTPTSPTIPKPMPSRRVPPLERPPQPLSPSVEEEIEEIPPPPPPKVSVKVSKGDSENTIPLDEVNEQFKQIESQFRKIYSHQKKTESQTKKFRSNFRDIDNKLKKIEKSLKILLETNKKLESIHKDTTKNLKNVKL